MVKISGHQKKGYMEDARLKDKVETPIHDSIRELVTWECKEHGVNIMNVLPNPKGKCWALESDSL
jgi:hypothetical protein